MLVLIQRGPILLLLCSSSSLAAESGLRFSSTLKIQHKRLKFTDFKDRNEDDLLLEPFVAFHGYCASACLRNVARLPCAFARYSFAIVILLIGEKVGTVESKVAWQQSVMFSVINVQCRSIS